MPFADLYLDDQGHLVPYAHTHVIDLGRHHVHIPNPKYSEILDWCTTNLDAATYNRHVADFGRYLMIQFQDMSDAALFALTWSRQ